MLRKDWSKHTSQTHGAVYYYNKVTNASHYANSSCIAHLASPVPYSNQKFHVPTGQVKTKWLV